MSIKSIAFYLPQFHPIPENNKWWGTGFTEWTNVAKAKPYFIGHEQPKLPADLGFYDLRVPEVREEQARLAKEAGIAGFCYWHYWFGNGRRILERPFNEVIEFKKPDFPFCLAWANETWSGVWHGASDRVLLEQNYPGKQDYIDHFYEILPALMDSRYIRVNEKPLFLVYKPLDIPDIIEFSETFKKEAKKNGLDGIYLVATNVPDEWNPGENGFDAVVQNNVKNILKENNIFIKIKLAIAKNIFFKKIYHKLFNRPILVFSFSNAMKFFVKKTNSDFVSYEQIVTGWDNTPRSGLDGVVYTKYTPELFKKHVTEVLQKTKRNKQDIVFIKSWNEWAEGNYLEPDNRYGGKFLKVLKEALQ